jgi:integrase
VRWKQNGNSRPDHATFIAVRTSAAVCSAAARWPSIGEQRVYVATTDQVWQLYELFPARMRLSVVLGTFVGLRLAEACGLRVEDVDFPPGGRPSQGSVPGPAAEVQDVNDAGPRPVSLVEQCSAQITAYGRYMTLLTGEDQRRLSPWAIERAMRKPAVRLRTSPRASATDDVSSRSTSRTHAGSGAAGPRRSPASACSQSRSRSGPR